MPGGPARRMSAKTPGFRSCSAPAPPAQASGEPVRDRDLAELLAQLADGWESADERRRGPIDWAVRDVLARLSEPRR